MSRRTEPVPEPTPEERDSAPDVFVDPKPLRLPSRNDPQSLKELNEYTDSLLADEKPFARFMGKALTFLLCGAVVLIIFLFVAGCIRIAWKFAFGG